VNIMISHRLHIFSVAGLSLMALVMAAVLMSWIKMGAAAVVVTSIFLTFFVAVSHRMTQMFTLFDIPTDMLVTGAVQVQHPNAVGTGVDLSRLNPGARAALEAQQAAMGNYQRLDETDDGSSVQTSTISAASGMAGRRASGPQGSFFSSVSTAFGGSKARARACEHAAGSTRPAPTRVASTRPAPATWPAPRAAQAPAVPESNQKVMHEGHLFKKGEQGMMRGGEMRRRYFVLKGTRLYYFRAWEDWGSGGTSAAINASSPIDMGDHEPFVLTDDGSRRPPRPRAARRPSPRLRPSAPPLSFAPRAGPTGSTSCLPARRSRASGRCRRRRRRSSP
jgi:hypothetical protein